MKIKHQLFIFITSIFFIPLLCCLLIPVMMYQSKAENENFILLSQISNPEEQMLSTKELELIKKITKRIPKGIDYIILKDHKVLLSSLEEYHASSNIQDENLIKQIQSNSEKYIYQFETLKVNPGNGETTNLKFITRIKKSIFKKNNINLIILIAYSVIIVVLIISIIGIYIISKSIFKSINKLVKQTHEIAEGNLNEHINENDYPDDALKIISESIETMRKNLIETQEKKSRFLMGVSHDLRTPIAVIKGYAEALSDEVIKSEEQTKQALNIILDKTNTLELMVNTLLDYVKLDSKDWQNELKIENLSKFIDDFFKNAIITGTLFKRIVKTENNLKSDTLIKYNGLLVQRALENLLSNAIRYTHDNDEIFLSANETESNILLSIKDSGVGMTKNDEKHIFDLFFRGTTSRREGGMGIGLSVVKTIIEIHNWNISVSSELNKGTEFIITINKPKLTLENSPVN